MSNPIFARLEAEAGILIHHGQLDAHDFQRVWRRIKAQAQTPAYDSPNNVPEENPMSVDTIRTDFENLLTKAETDAAKVNRYESEPMVKTVLDLLDAIPEARDILTPVLAGVTRLAAMKPAEVAAVVEAPVDPQIQTGVAS